MYFQQIAVHVRHGDWADTDSVLTRALQKTLRLRFPHMYSLFTRNIRKGLRVRPYIAVASLLSALVLYLSFFFFSTDEPCYYGRNTLDI